MSEKICRLCGEDCSDRPRTKDKRGQYYCRTCYEDAIARQRAKRVAEEQQAASLESDIGLGEPDATDRGLDADVLSGLLPDATSGAPTAVVQKNACTNCGAALEAGAVLCIACGTSVASGKSSMTQVSAEPPAPSSPWTAPFDLYIRPFTFHRNWTLQIPGLLLWLMLVLGWSGNYVSRYLDRLEVEVSMNGVGVEAPWLIIWARGGFVAVVLMPGLVTLIQWPIYWVRLRLAGESQPGYWRTMRVMLVSQLTFLLPLAFAMLFLTFSADSATAAVSEYQGAIVLFGTISLALLYVSIWVSFCGVRTIFETKMWRAVVLFLALPWVAITSILILAFVFFAIIASELEAQGAARPADFGHASVADESAVNEDPNRPAGSFRFERDGLRLYYPRAWEYSESPFSELPSQTLWFESKRNDVSVQVSVVPTTSDPSEQLAAIMSSVREEWGQEITGESSFTEHGQFSGAGAVVDFHAAEVNEPGKLRVFVAPFRPGLLLEVQEIFLLADGAEERASLEMMRETLTRVE